VDDDLVLILQIDLCVPELEEDWGGGGGCRKQEEGRKEGRNRRLRKRTNHLVLEELLKQEEGRKEERERETQED
jgi:hypothetical protein